MQAVKVPETEEVSDEELPGPKRAELPADTEVVSEDELPTVKKEAPKRKLAEGDYDPGSPTSEGETPSKKPSLESAAVKEEDKKEKPKKLPELDKYWKAVNDDPTDFTGWTYLLQYVDQEVSFDFGWLVVIFLCVYCGRMTWRPPEKPTTRSCPTTPTATATGANTPTTRSAKATRRSAKRYVNFSRHIPCNALYTHIIILQSLQLGVVAAKYYDCSEYKIRYCKCICSLLFICYLSCNCVILQYLIYLYSEVR